MSLHNDDSFIYTHPYQRQQVRNKVEDNNFRVCSVYIIVVEGQSLSSYYLHLTIYVDDNDCHVYSEMTMIAPPQQ